MPNRVWPELAQEIHNNTKHVLVDVLDNIDLCKKTQKYKHTHSTPDTIRQRSTRREKIAGSTRYHRVRDTTKYGIPQGRRHAKKCEIRETGSNLRRCHSNDLGS